MNKIDKGKLFEREALEILKKLFDEVIWLSEKKKSIFDFKCIKNNKIFFGEAKLTLNNIPRLTNNQKSADGELNEKTPLLVKEVGGKK